MESRPIRGDRGPWERKLRLLFWMRVGLVGALVLCIFPFVVTFVRSPLVSNMFVINGPAGVALVSALAVFAGWTCGLSVVLVRLYAPTRMRDDPDEQKEETRGSAMKLAGFSSLLSIPTIFCVLHRSSAGIGELVAAVAGAIVPTIVGIFLSQWLWKLGARQEETAKSSWLAGWMIRRGPWLSEGYVHRTRRGASVVHPGHWVAVGLMVVLFAAYAAIGVGYAPGRFHYQQPPALLYVLILFMMLTTMLAAMSFFLDRFRVPLLLVVIAWNFISLTSNAQHTFLVYPYGSSKQGEPQALKSEAPVLSSVRRPLDTRPTDGRFKDTIVIVCASGGGIHAAAWTTRVLTWLHEDVGEDFTRATRFYSGVSGGSVGLMYFLEAYRNGGTLTPGALQAIRASADKPSLSQVAWGLAYPDFGRAWAPFLSPGRFSRGRTLELAWRQHPGAGGDDQLLNIRWSDWVRSAAEGTFPGVAFNAFEITRGHRLLFNNVAMPGAIGAQPVTALRSDWNSEAPNANRLDLDLDVVTAARLSATFPYVTPISTPEIDANRSAPSGGSVPKPAAWAVGDGGYFDNAGLMTAVEWIRAVESAGALEGVKQILLLEIRAFPRSNDTSSPSVLDRWRFSVLGPILGMLQTRTSSQIDRGDLELLMLNAELNNQPSLTHLVFEPLNKNWPLSWQMSEEEIRSLDDVRQRPQYQCSLKKITESVPDRKAGPRH